MFKPEYEKQNIKFLSVSSSHSIILLEKKGHLKVVLSAHLFVKTQTSILKMTYFYLLNMLKKAHKVFIGLMQINIYIASQICHIPRVSCQNIWETWIYINLPIFFVNLLVIRTSRDRNGSYFTFPFTVRSRIPINAINILQNAFCFCISSLLYSFGKWVLLIQSLT